MNAESKNILKKSAGNLFTAGLAVCLGSGLSIIYLECIRLLADSCLKKMGAESGAYLQYLQQA